MKGNYHKLRSIKFLSFKILIGWTINFMKNFEYLYYGHRIFLIKNAIF